MPDDTGPVGLLGGTFDPIHHGHLRLAEEVADALNLPQVRLMPAGIPPHRPPPRANAQDREAMVKLAIANNPRLALETHELGLNRPAYMVETLEALRDRLGVQRPLLLFVGADAFLGLTSWHRWTQLFELCHLVVCHRPGHTDWQAQLPEPLDQAWRQRRATAASLAQAPAGLLIDQDITQLDISATQIRRLLAAGRSPRYLLPEPVLDYIHAHRLYL